MTTAHKHDYNHPLSEHHNPALSYHDATVRVRYAETDQMGVVYHANYLIWMEIGRVELLRALSVEYKQMEIQDDCHIMVVDVRCASARTLRRRAAAAFTLRMKSGATPTASCSRPAAPGTSSAARTVGRSNCRRSIGERSQQARRVRRPPQARQACKFRKGIKSQGR